MPHWTKKFFIDEEKYWRYLMDKGWESAPAQAGSIVKILKKYGITRGRILELCCGNGRICTNLAKKGFKAIGIDLSPAYIEDAKKRSRKSGAKADYVCGDVRQLDRHVKGKFDAIVNIWTAIGYYDRRTDERLFRAAGRRLRRGGVFLVLNTMSRERLLNHYCPAIYDDVGDYLIIHRGNFDHPHSQILEHWDFYEKRGKDLKFMTELETSLRIYAHHEITEMAERAGLKFAAAYDTLLRLDPVRPDSGINMVFQKP
jgi:SAM-dependent methyltransferase